MYRSLRSLALVICLSVASNAVAQPIDLGPATGYNVFSCEDWYGGHHVEGYTAIANRVYFNSFSLGSGVPGGDVLVVGDNLALAHGTIHGNAINDGLQIDLGGVTFANGGSWQSGVPIDFADACAELEDTSTELAGFSVNGNTVVYPWGVITMVGTAADTNVFEIDGNDILGANTLIISAPAGSSVLVNVTGGYTRFQNMGMVTLGIGREDVLFNFPEASFIVLKWVQFEGSILAPFATVQASWGNFMGTMAAGDLRGCHEYHNFPFGGELVDPNVNPAPTSCEVDYDVINQWPDGFQASVEITHHGPATGSWDLAFTFDNGESVVNGWNGTWTQYGDDVEVTDAGWNAVVDDGGTVTLGFIGEGEPITPAEFVFNGMVCQ